MGPAELSETLGLSSKYCPGVGDQKPGVICLIVELAYQLGKRKVIPLGRKIVGKTMQDASRIWFAASKNSFGPCKAALKQPEDA